MATFDYDNSRATANRLIAKFGQAATLRRVTTGAYDTSSGAVTQTTVDFPVLAVMLNFSQFERAQGLVEVNDKKALVAVGDLTSAPAVKDRFVVVGESYEVVNAQALSPAGVDVLYTLQLRG